jgi:hypothetical protein
MPRGGKGSGARGGKRRGAGRPRELSQSDGEELMHHYSRRMGLLKALGRPKPHRPRVIKELAKEFLTTERMVVRVLAEVGVRRWKANERRLFLRK